ncbi:MAG: SDH family Clp fold serine proteinase [Solirubrobacterales bacterium]
MDSNDPKIATDPLLQRILGDIAQDEVDAQRKHSEIDQAKLESILYKHDLFDAIEDSGRSKRRLVAYLAGQSAGSEINLTDAAPIGSILDAIGEVPYLDLMLNSPGGSGDAAEKIIEMCREHCTKEFRVIVPNYAKSAATIITLGADSIVMGYLSELGPIDPQYMISVGGVQHWVSGQDFVHAYEGAHVAIQEAVDDGKSPLGYLHSLSVTTMEPAFIEHCRRGIEFSRDVAIKHLPKYQLPAKYRGQRKGRRQLEACAAEAAENLLSENSRFSHGRLIGASEARDEVGLNVNALDRTDPVWEAYWEIYVRAELYMQAMRTRVPEPVAKLFFDRNGAITAY